MAASAGMQHGSGGLPAPPSDTTAEVSGSSVEVGGRTKTEEKKNKLRQLLRDHENGLVVLIRSGRLRTVKAGRRRLVPLAAVTEYVASLDAA
jgi:hypothetical protein